LKQNELRILIKPTCRLQARAFIPKSPGWTQRKRIARVVDRARQRWRASSFFSCQK